jgi:methylase of polypeptide subunit release factors
VQVSLLLDEIALAAARLAEAGVESPRAEAELIAAHVHGVRRAELHTVPDASFDARFWEGVGRRAAREPLQHITGRAYFRYLELEVGPGVFVPRPETEVMTGWAIDRLREMDVAEPVVVDLGTGSGAIALAIAQEAPRARVHAVEADPIARGWTEKNVARVASAAPYTRGRVTLHSADFTGADFTEADFTEADFTGADFTGADFTRSDFTRADFTRSDLTGADLTRSDLSGADLSGADLSGADLSGADLSGADLSGADLSGADFTGADFTRSDLAGADFAGPGVTAPGTLGELAGQADLVISNPPYIPLGATVPPEVGEYDPPAALWGGADGLDAIRAVERAARRLLRPGGMIAVEHGAPQGAAVYWVFCEEAGWRDTRNHKDLARRDRFVTATWPGERADG